MRLRAAADVVRRKKTEGFPGSQRRKFKGGVINCIDAVNILYMCRFQCL